MLPAMVGAGCSLFGGVVEHQIVLSSLPLPNSWCALCGSLVYNRDQEPCTALSLLCYGFEQQQRSERASRNCTAVCDTYDALKCQLL